MAKPNMESAILDRIQGRLRGIRRARVDVNAARAEFLGSVAFKKKSALKKIPPRRRTFDPDRRIKDTAKRKSLKRGDLKQLEKEVWVNCFVTLSENFEEFKNKRVTDRSERLCTISAPLSELEEIAGDESGSVLSIDLADTIKGPAPNLGSPATSADDRPNPKLGNKSLVGRHKYGHNVLVGIIDVGGFDFSHPDFVDDKGKTRFVRIWDQGGNVRSSPAGYDYGSEFTGAHLNHAMRTAAAEGKLPATTLEPQSQRVRSSHGTHVASIAAGNGGICRNAMIAGVLVSLPPADEDRRLSFFDSTRVAHAVKYLLQVREEVGASALVINISLGTNGGAHDASSPMSRWIDHALSTPGRAVCVAAGNAGQEAPVSTNELGFLMGRIHTSGTVPATELQHDLHWIVVGDGVEDVSENELEIWYKAHDRFAVQLKPPGGKWIGPVEPGEFFENEMLDDRTFVSIYSELYDAGNGDNRIAIYLSPFMSTAGVAGVTPGRWTIRLIGRQIRDGRFHGWIERDDIAPIGRVGDKAYWRFPSFFAEGSNVDDSSVSSLACGQRVISAANLNDTTNRINITSSQGPTRDGRFKPEIAAPGTEILAASGFDSALPWVRMSGTSMASPYVAGVIGLMLALNPKLTAAQIGGIIQRTARPLPGQTYAWRNDAGYGQIDPLSCLKEVEKATIMKRLNPSR